MFRLAFGPLGLRHGDLRLMTLGQLVDLIEGYHYRVRLEAERDARLACWICNGAGMRSEPLRPEDLVGIWADGRSWTKDGHRKHLEDQLRRRRKEGAGRWRNGTP